MQLTELHYKKISEIEGLERFDEYAVDVNGNVWSFKFNKIRKLTPGWAKKRGSYLFVRLCDNKGNKTNFYVHRLVALAYLPRNEQSQEIRHKDGDLTNNKLENLEWTSKSKNRKDNATFNIEFDESLSDKIKKVHYLSSIKGLPVSDIQSFCNMIMNNALEQHINQYGLRRMML